MGTEWGEIRVGMEGRRESERGGGGGQERRKCTECC
jgi:hypothetical protein